MWTETRVGCCWLADWSCVLSVEKQVQTPIPNTHSACADEQVEQDLSTVTEALQTNVNFAKFVGDPCISRKKKNESMALAMASADETTRKLVGWLPPLTHSQQPRALGGEESGRRYAPHEISRGPSPTRSGKGLSPRRRRGPPGYSRKALSLQATKAPCRRGPPEISRSHTDTQIQTCLTDTKSAQVSNRLFRVLAEWCVDEKSRETPTKK